MTYDICFSITGDKKKVAYIPVSNPAGRVIRILTFAMNTWLEQEV